MSGALLQKPPMGSVADAGRAFGDKAVHGLPVSTRGRIGESLRRG